MTARGCRTWTALAASELILCLHTQGVSGRRGVGADEPRSVVGNCAALPDLEPPEEGGSHSVDLLAAGRPGGSWPQCAEALNSPFKQRPPSILHLELIRRLPMCRLHGLVVPLRQQVQVGLDLGREIGLKQRPYAQLPTLLTILRPFEFDDQTSIHRIFPVSVNCSRFSHSTASKRQGPGVSRFDLA